MCVGERQVGKTYCSNGVGPACRRRRRATAESHTQWPCNTRHLHPATQQQQQQLRQLVPLLSWCLLTPAVPPSTPLSSFQTVTLERHLPYAIVQGVNKVTLVPRDPSMTHDTGVEGLTFEFKWEW